MDGVVAIIQGQAFSHMASAARSVVDARRFRTNECYVTMVEAIEHFMYVNRLFLTSKRSENHTRFEKCMRNKYKEIKINFVKVVAYIGTTFDFIARGQVSISMANCESSTLSDCGMWSCLGSMSTRRFVVTRLVRMRTLMPVLAMSLLINAPRCPSR